MLDYSDLHHYQLRAVRHIIKHRKCALFLDMGLGKTVVTLTAIEWLMHQELDVQGTLVIAPKRVAESVWPAEVKKWKHLRGLTLSLITGSPQERRIAIQRDADIHVISRDNVVWLHKEFPDRRLPWDMLVIDESSSFKSPKAKRFKALKKRQPGFKRIVELTGTPAPNGLMDLWAQIWLLDRGERLGRTLGEYRSRYFKPGARNGYIVYNWRLARKENEQLIHKQLSDICLSMKSEDYLDLKPPEHNPIYLKMPPAIRRQYEEFEAEQVLELFPNPEEAEITALNAAALSNKLLQFANGAIYDEDRQVHPVHDIKLDAVQELIESSQGQPVLIAWAFHHDRDRLKERLKKYKPRELKTDKDIADWNQGKIQVLLMHPASGEHGLNLQQGGNILVWFGQTWSLDLYRQLNKRLDRQGQTKTVTIHHLLTEGTIDTKVMQALKHKTKQQDSLIEAVKARVEKYLHQL